MLEQPEVPHSAEFGEEDFSTLLHLGLGLDSPAEVKYARSFLERLHLNGGLVKNRYWVYPVDNPRFNEVQVGRGVVGSVFCGRFESDMVCHNVEGHKGVMLGDVNCSGKVVVRHRILRCHKSSCPICFYDGWASRLARSIEGRIAEGERRGLGKADHVTVSVPKADRDLPEAVLRRRCAAAAFDRGMNGFTMIYHAVRKDKLNKKLFRSPHYHLLGFITGGFDVCRNCGHGGKDCASCTGFKGREVRGYAKDGYLVKVHDVRKTIFGTAKYSLGHATLVLGMKRSAVVTHWGTIACCEFKSFPTPIDDSCPACKEEMVRSVKVGKTVVVRDVGSCGFASVVAVPELDEYGDPNYVPFEEVGRHG